MGVIMMGKQGITVGLTLALAVGVAACSSSTAPSSAASGGANTTITASSTTTGGAYGSGGNYFFSPTPDTVAVGAAVTYAFGSVTHNVHFAAVANAPDSIPATFNTTVVRTFTTPGTYMYTCLIHNISGVVVVH
jgi:plastocyanin